MLTLLVFDESTYEKVNITIMQINHKTIQLTIKYTF